MTWEYSEDNLIEQTAIDLFFNQLGWDTLLAYNKESFGEGSIGLIPAIKFVESAASVQPVSSE